MPIALVLALSACATPTPSAPAAASATPAPTNSAPTAPSRLARFLGTAGGADAPALAVVEQELGAPDVRRQDGAGASLTYRYENCALVLLFAADASNQMKLAATHPGPRRAGAAAPSLQQCADEAEARRRS